MNNRPYSKYDDTDTLRKQRKRLNMTQKQVADKAGIAVITYQRFETGERNIRTATFQVVCDVLRALELSVDDFLDK